MLEGKYCQIEVALPKTVKVPIFRSMIGATSGWHFYFSFLVVVAHVQILCSLNAYEYSNLCTNRAQAELYSKPMPTYLLQVLTTRPLPANEVLS